MRVFKRAGSAAGVGVERRRKEGGREEGGDALHGKQSTERRSLCSHRKLRARPRRFASVNIAFFKGEKKKQHKKKPPKSTQKLKKIKKQTKNNQKTSKNQTKKTPQNKPERKR